MKKSEFDKIADEVPKIMPMFELTKPDDWMTKEGYLKGHRFLCNGSCGVMIPLDSKHPKFNSRLMSLSPYATKYKFIKYVLVKEDEWEGRYEIMGNYNGAV